MKPYTLPQALYGLEGIRTILIDGENAILHKILDRDLIDNEKLITAHSLVYVINGKVCVTTYEGEEVSISNGQMLFMPRDSYVISDFLRNGKPMEVFLLFFDHEIVSKFLELPQNTDSAKQRTVCTLQTTPNIEYYFENLVKVHYENLHDKNLLELKLLEFFHLLNEQQDFMQTLHASESGKKDREIDTLMLQHYDKNMTVADFAALSGRSLSTFNREFKKKHNQTPKQWLIQKRMQRASILLKEGRSVTETAFETGYMNVSNFIKAYRSVYGQTPKVMQQNSQ